MRAAANRLGAPGVAGGATLGQNQNLYQVLSACRRHNVHTSRRGALKNFVTCT